MKYTPVILKAWRDRIDPGTLKWWDGLSCQEQSDFRVGRLLAPLDITVTRAGEVNKYGDILKKIKALIESCR
jgi:hypothetical protein